LILEKPNVPQEPFEKKIDEMMKAKWNMPA